MSYTSDTIATYEIHDNILVMVGRDYKLTNLNMEKPVKIEVYKEDRKKLKNMANDRDMTMPNLIKILVERLNK